MTRYAMLCAALLLASPAAAQDQDPPAGADAGENSAQTLLNPQSTPENFDLARRKVIDCEGEKFVFAWGAGASPTKVTLCSKKDATDEEVVLMLDEAATKIENSNIPEDRRVALSQQIRAKMAELKRSATDGGASSAAVDVPVNARGSGPVFEAPSAAPAQVARPAVAPPVRPPATPVVARPVLPAKPRLTFECYTPGQIGSGGPCALLARGTLLTVTARDALAGGASLRFVRNGHERGEVALAALRKGQSQRVALPRALCAGVVGAETRIDVVASGQVVDSLGPYELRC